MYCGSNSGLKGGCEIYEKVAGEFGIFLAKEKIGLIYGGANVGLMGAVSKSCHEFY